jgi:hypothetical protein
MARPAGVQHQQKKTILNNCIINDRISVLIDEIIYSLLLDSSN